MTLLLAQCAWAGNGLLEPHDRLAPQAGAGPRVALTLDACGGSCTWLTFTSCFCAKYLSIVGSSRPAARRRGTAVYSDASRRTSETRKCFTFCLSRNFVDRMSLTLFISLYSIAANRYGPCVFLPIVRIIKLSLFKNYVGQISDCDINKRIYDYYNNLT